MAIGASVVMCVGAAAPAASGRHAGREVILAGIRLDSTAGYGILLRTYGNPTRIVNGSGAQSGGFGVNGYASATGASGPGMGGGYPGMSGGYPGSGGGPPALPSGLGGGGGGAASGASDQSGLVTWVYDNPRGVVGDTVMVTFDDQNNGRVTTVRVLGLKPYPAETRAGIRLSDTFAQVLERYGYPDMTVPMDYSHTAVYYFKYNVAFGFEGNGPSMKVDSITIGIGEQPVALPTAGGMGGGYPGMGGGYPGMSGGYPGMSGGYPGMSGGYPGMGGGYSPAMGGAMPGAKNLPGAAGMPGL